jgi:CRISPR/Cas system-associated exonuclease Cas4 (RecB family)
MTTGLIKTARLGKKPDEDIVGLLGVLEEAYVNSRPKEKYTKKNTFSPSVLGYGPGTCPRYWYLAFEGGNFVSTFDGLSIANMENGTLAHQRIEKLFGDAGVLSVAEKEILSEDPPIRGFADVIVEYAGRKFVGEFKTTRQEAYVHRETKGEPVDYHKVQVLIYMKVLGIDEGFLLYENKNTQQLLLIPVNMDEENTEYADYLFDWMRQVRKLWEDKKLPERPYTPKSRACKACSLFDVCRDKTPDGDVTFKKLEVRK